MLLNFKTKTNANGWAYRMIIDTNAKTFNTNASAWADYITISLKDYKQLIKKLRALNFKEIY